MLTFNQNLGRFQALALTPGTQEGCHWIGKVRKCGFKKKELVSKWSGREVTGKNVKRASFSISEWNAATWLVNIPWIFPTMGNWGSKPSVGATPEEDSSALAGHTSPTKIVFRAQVERCLSMVHSIAQAYVQGLCYAAKVWDQPPPPLHRVGIGANGGTFYNMPGIPVECWLAVRPKTRISVTVIPQRKYAAATKHFSDASLHHATGWTVYC